MAKDVATFGDRHIPRIERAEAAQFTSINEVSKYRCDFRGKDPNTMKSNSALWRNVLEDVAIHAPREAERWSFGRLSREEGYYFVKYYARTSAPT